MIPAHTILFCPALLFLAACNGSNSEVVQKTGGPDTEPPQIVRLEPDENARGIPGSQSVIVEFDEVLLNDASTRSALALHGPEGPVEGTTAVRSNRLQLEPAAALALDTDYLATLSAGVADMRGNTTQQGREWRFHTMSPECPGGTMNSLVLPAGTTSHARASNSKRPTKGDYHRDPAHGSCVTRATDHENEPPQGFARNDYSRRQAFNADGSLFLVHALDGYWHLYDGRDLSYIRRLDMGGSEVEPQWHPSDPWLLYTFPHNGGLVIRLHNVMDDSRSIVADFREVKAIAGHPGATSIKDIWPTAARLWTKNEGSPSADARYWGLMVETENFQGLGLITYDMQADQILGVYDFASDGSGIGRPDHVSMSPSGQFIVPSWYAQDCSSASSLGTHSRPCGLMAFRRDFSTGRGLAVRGEHSDIGIDAEGRDVLVMPNYDNGWVEMYDLATGETTRLWRIYIYGAATAMHVSAKNYDKPGWVLISTYATRNPRGADLWYDGLIMAVQLRPNPLILHIAHTYNITDDYFSEPHAVVNRDFTRVLFNSNWNSGNFRDIDAYMITLAPATIAPR